MKPIRICIIGAGPKGTMMLNRLCANAPVVASDVPVVVHVIDPFPPGCGRVWRTDQPSSLIMNTPAADTTVFAGASTGCTGPPLPGPTLYEWASEVADGHVAVTEPELLPLAMSLQPHSQAPRAFYGWYLAWAWQYIVSTAVGRMKICMHRSRAVAIHDLPDGRQSVHLAGEPGAIDVDAVILTQGHFDVVPTAEQQALAAVASQHRLVYMPPTCPAEADLAPIAAASPVILRGLGLSFYDYVTLLTVERGGRFRRSDDRLVYVPCGREPVIYAGSGRGMPYPVRADSRVPGPEPFQPRFFDAAAIARLRKVAGTGANDFMRDVWPLVTKEVCWAYYSVLYAQIYKSVGFDCFAREFAAADWDSARMHRLISLTFPDPATHWDWNRVNQPCEGRRFRGRNEYQAWVVDKLRDNLEQAALGVEESPQRAATSVLRALREQVRHAISHCGISGSSYRQHVDGWFRNLTNYLVAGPPAVRTEELIALMQAAVVRLVGPRICVVFDPSSNAFNASSEAVKDRPVTAGAMIDAHLPEPDIPRSADPLIAMMLAAGGCRPHVIADPSGDGYTVGGLDVTENEFRVVRADGTAHPRRFAYGPPLRGAQGPFGTSIRAALQHADSIARWALSEAGAGHSPRRIGFHATGGDGVN